MTPLRRLLWDRRYANEGHRRFCCDIDLKEVEVTNEEESENNQEDEKLENYDLREVLVRNQGKRRDIYEEIN